MTRPKKPLPSLRFVVLEDGEVLYRLIPHTDRKGRVARDLWALPGGRLSTTDELIAQCRQRGWTWNVEGDDSAQPRRNEL